MLNYNEMSKEMLIAHIQTMDMQLNGFADDIYRRNRRITELQAQLQDHSAKAFSIGETYANALSRIAELEAQIAGKPADTDKLREAIANISNNQITEAWESCGGVDGFYKSFGYQQFAHAILDLAADTVASTALQAPVREVPEESPMEIRKGFMCANCLHVYDSVAPTQCDCLPKVQAYIECEIRIPALPAAPVQQEGE